jgi:hypothetical protein
MRKNDYYKQTYKFEQHDFYHEHQWGYLSRDVNVPSTIQILQNKLWALLGGYNKYNDIYIIKKKKLSEPLFLREILNKGLFFSKTPVGEVLSSVKLTFPDLKANPFYDNSNSFL